MIIDFAGKTVLVTGATRGIGKAIAEDLKSSGANLILTGTSSEQIEYLNRENEMAGIKEVKYLQVDFSDESSLDSFLAELASCERIDVCINNAGTNRINFIEDTSIEDYDYLMNINLRSPFLICRQVSQMMKKAGYGRIVNIASIWSIKTKPKRSLYTMTKCGLAGMTKTLAVELAPFNVLANTVSPGFTMTELTESTLKKEEIENLSQDVPANRFAEPAEISKVVMFLASDLNTYITGQNIIVDGGFVCV